MNLTAQHRKPRQRSALATCEEITFVASRQLHYNNVLQERPSGYYADDVCVARALMGFIVATMIWN